ncbi:MAG: lysophospholipid acyltransferase family protein [Actinomycetota bacterium]
MNVNQLIIYDLIKWFGGPVFSALLRVKCEGAENIPETGGGIIVGNHRQPVLDPMIVMFKTERPVTWGGNKDTFNVPFFRVFARIFGVVPLEMKGGKKAGDALDALVEAAKEGEIVGLFPEGDRAVLGLAKATRVMNFHTGFARVALRARIPVIPSAIIVHEEIHLPNIPPFITRKFWDHPVFNETGHPVTVYNRVTFRVGRPIDLGEFYDEPITAPMLNKISGKVRRVVNKLYEGEDLDRFMSGETPFDIVNDRV